MSVKVIMQQIEIGFWDVFVAAMHKSAFLQFLILRVYRLIYSKEIHKTMAWILSMIVLGLTTGLIIGALSEI